MSKTVEDGLKSKPWWDGFFVGIHWGLFIGLVVVLVFDMCGVIK